MLAPLPPPNGDAAPVVLPNNVLPPELPPNAGAGDVAPDLLLLFPKRPPPEDAVPVCPKGDADVDVEDEFRLKLNLGGSFAIFAMIVCYTKMAGWQRFKSWSRSVDGRVQEGASFTNAKFSAPSESRVKESECECNTICTVRYHDCFMFLNLLSLF